MELYNEIRRSLYAWYDMAGCRRILLVGEGQAFCWPDGVTVTCVSWEQVAGGQLQETGFDLLLADCGFEMLAEPDAVLAVLPRCLAPQGRMLLAMNNPFGLRYFCGDRDPYTEQSFAGLEGYRLAYGKREDVFRGRHVWQRQDAAMAAGNWFYGYAVLFGVTGFGASGVFV